MSNPNPHAAHDELLIARLFGDDVDERERAVALAQMDACEDCAALFADLGSIRDATVALPVPARPRDFRLAEANAARLRPRRSGPGRVLGLGLRRSLGGAMVALGFSGVLLTGIVAAFPGGIATMSALDTGNKSAPEVASSGDQGAFSASSAGTLNGGGTSVTDQTQSNSPAAPTVAPAATSGAIAVATAAATMAATNGGYRPAGSPGEVSGPTTGGVIPAAVTPAPTATAHALDVSSGISLPDARMLALIVFALLLVAGVLTLSLPALRRRLAGR